MATGILLRAVAGVVLFWISYLDLAILQHLHTGDGFWELAPDARSYYRAAAAAVESQLSTISVFDASPFYVGALAIWMMLVGVSPASSILLNLLCYVIICRAIVAVGPTRDLDRGKLLIPFSAFTFSPALLIFGTQSLKDTVFALLVALCGLGWIVAAWPAGTARNRWATPLGLSGVLAVTFLISGIRAYFALFIWASSAGMFIAAAFARPRGLVRYTAKATAILVGIWLCFMLGGGPYYDLYSPARFFGWGTSAPTEAPAVVIEEARESFIRTGGATNVVPSFETRMARALLSLAVMFIPVSALQGVGLVDFDGGRGLLLLTDLDTVFLDVFIVLSLRLVYLNRSALPKLPAVVFLLFLTAGTALLMSYVVTNYGTLFRLRLMLAVPVWLIPSALLGHARGGDASEINAYPANARAGLWR